MKSKTIFKTDVLNRTGYGVLMTGLIYWFSAPVYADSLFWEPANRNDNYNNTYQPDYYQGNAINNLFDKNLIGPLVGAAVGGYLGSKIGGGKGQLAATAAGTMIGYVLGGKLMSYMDNRDRYNTSQALEYSGNNQTIAWTNPETQTNYSVTPVNSFQTNGNYCREFITRAMIDGRSEQIQGTACRQSDGHWQTRK